MATSDFAAQKRSASSRNLRTMVSTVTSGRLEKSAMLDLRKYVENAE
jgi:hypothetical protein